MNVPVEERRIISEHIWKLLELKESMLRVKSGQLWLKEGDQNTRFFHKSLKCSLRKKCINTVHTKDGMVESVEEVKYHFRQHFMNLFKEPYGLGPVPEGLCFKRMEEGASMFLERLFMEDEVKQAV